MTKYEERSAFCVGTTRTWIKSARLCLPDAGVAVARNRQRPRRPARIPAPPAATPHRRWLVEERLVVRLRSTNAKDASACETSLRRSGPDALRGLPKGGGLVRGACPEIARVRSRRTVLISGQEIFHEPDLPRSASARASRDSVRREVCGRSADWTYHIDPGALGWLACRTRRQSAPTATKGWSTISPRC